MGSWPQWSPRGGTHEFAQAAPTASDVAAFQARLARLDRHEARTIDHPPVPSLPRKCDDCRDNDHAHASAVVGPYVLCRCLDCPTLVVA